MPELLKAKQEAFDKELFHRAQIAKHERLARKYQLQRLGLNEKIRSMERDLAEPIKIVYGSA
jgi:ribosomal protein L32E